MPRGDATKKVWKDPEKRARMAAGIKRAVSTPEVREKMSASHKKWWADRKSVPAARMTAAIERMSVEEKSCAEIIRVAPQTGLPDLETLDRLIQKRVAEAQASQGLILEPWFQPAAVADELRRRLGIFHRRKWALYFDFHGCLLCGTKKEAHSSNGMCRNCFDRVVRRLRQIEKAYAEAHPQEYVDQQIDRISRRVSSAERILGTARPTP